jgi:hypothetical protein
MSDTNRLSFDPIPVTASSRPELPKVPELPPMPSVKPPSTLAATSRPATIVETPAVPSTAPPSRSWWQELFAPTHSKGVIALGLLSLVAGAGAVRYIWPPKPVPTHPETAATPGNGLPTVPPEMAAQNITVPSVAIPTLDTKSAVKSVETLLSGPSVIDVKPIEFSSPTPAPKLTDSDALQLPIPSGIKLTSGTEPVPAPKPAPPSPETPELKLPAISPLSAPTPAPVAGGELKLPIPGTTASPTLPVIGLPNLDGDKKPAPPASPAMPDIKLDLPKPSEIKLDLPKAEPAKIPDVKLDLQPPTTAIPVVTAPPKPMELSPVELPPMGTPSLVVPAAPKLDAMPTTPKVVVTTPPLREEPIPVTTDIKPLTVAPALEPPVVKPTVAPPEPTPLSAKARTDYDVDLHYVKNGESWGSVSKQYFGDERYAEALKSYNRSATLSQLQRAEIPPLHILRASYSSVIGTPTPKPTEWSNITTAGATVSTPKPTASIEGTIARVTSGGPRTYVIPQGGRTIRQIAADAYGDENFWGKVWDNNPNLSPSGVIPEGTKLTLSSDARIGN